ncbi:glycosyltransferase family 4 protein [Ancylobacter radicis]|uniref:Glycosyltransferase family 4 protein n=1 Tax=Ancylobacter radicis TaxID=2836179 RepID=A0ABS5R369_9HYPH|nr:glycosyltransferase family 1 protein [Ancylobacter radicis]MBS9476103.1 glycosyltransferase family 4 protein [Ancylobacter radicis]
MLVSINGRFLDRPITGVERYGWEIMRALDGLVTSGHPDTRGFDFRILRPKGGAPIDFLEGIRQEFGGRGHGHAWEQLFLPFLARKGLLLNLCNFTPLLNGRSVTVVHDAHVWLIPDNFSLPFRAFYKVMLPLSIRRSARWITISRFSESELLRFRAAHRSADRIVGNSGEHILRSADTATAAGGAEEAPFVLALGSQSRNKNFALVRRIAPRLAELGICVRVVGGTNASVFSGGSAEPESGTGLVWLGRVNDEQLADLYSRAACFLFPSLFEGFGIPPLEAMMLGCPVVASNRTALPEVLGESAVLLDPHADDAWVEAVAEIVRDPVKRQALVAAGHEQATRYSWTQSALGILASLKEVQNA